MVESGGKRLKVRLEGLAHLGGRPSLFFDTQPKLALLVTVGDGRLQPIGYAGRWGGIVPRGTLSHRAIAVGCNTAMKIKGKSEKKEFTVEVSADALLGFLETVLVKSDENYDPELATSPGGLPTALFTCILPASAREAVGWDIQKEGWDGEKAMAAFEHRLERKQGGGFSIESRQATWDNKAEKLKAVGIDPVEILGKRPVAKA